MFMFMSNTPKVCVKHRNMYVFCNSQILRNIEKYPKDFVLHITFVIYKMKQEISFPAPTFHSSSMLLWVWKWHNRWNRCMRCEVMLMYDVDWSCSILTLFQDELLSTVSGEHVRVACTLYGMGFHCCDMFLPCTLHNSTNGLRSRMTRSHRKFQHCIQYVIRNSQNIFSYYFLLFSLADSQLTHCRTQCSSILHMEYMNSCSN